MTQNHGHESVAPLFSAHLIVPTADRTPKLSGLVLDRITVYEVVVERDVLGKSTIAVGEMKLRLSRYTETGRYMYVNADIGIYRVAQNKIPHRRICNISATSGLILKILEAA